MDVRINSGSSSNRVYTQPQTGGVRAGTQTSSSATATLARPQDQVIISDEARAKLEATQYAEAQTADEMNAGTAKAGIIKTDELSTSNAGNGETTFLSSFEALVNALEDRRQVVTEYYTKQHKENLKFNPPEQHIRDKYFNPKSPYYVKGMTKTEREIASTQEYRMLQGLSPRLNSDDYALRSVGGCNMFEIGMDANQTTRNQIDQSIQDLFNENGITIPEGVSFRLRVDPYDFYIHADGLEDDSLAQAIERALNRGDNGINLYYHIQSCRPSNFGYDDPPQYTQNDSAKMSIYHLVKSLTGYDIRELRNENDTFYTADGQDIWELLKQKAAEYPVPEGETFSLAQYRADYLRLSREGWDSSNDNDMSLNYVNGHLVDIDTAYGYGPGQTTWKDDLKNKIKADWAQYQAQREKTLLTGDDLLEAGTFSNFGSDAETKKEAPTPSAMGLYGLDGTFFAAKTIGPDIIESINEAIKAGQKPMADKIINLLDHR